MPPRPIGTGELRVHVLEREAGLSEGFSHFVTSMTAPVASGWSEFAGWGLHTLKSAAFSRRRHEPSSLNAKYSPPLRKSLPGSACFFGPLGLLRLALFPQR